MPLLTGYKKICGTGAMLLLWFLSFCPASALETRPLYPAAPAADIPDQVWKVAIKGNNTFSDMVLKERMAVETPSFFQKLMFWRRGDFPLDEVELQKDVIRLRNFYQRRGFRQVEVDYRIEDGNRQWKKKVIFTVNENAPTSIRDVEYVFEKDNKYEQSIRRDESFQSLKRSSPYKPGRRYETIREPEVIGNLTDMLKNLGFAYADVNISAQIDTARMAADVTIHMNTGPRTQISNIKVDGVQTISDRYVVRESGLKEGEQYSQDKIQEAQRELFSHHLFRFATIRVPDQPQDTSLNLLVEVREYPLRSVEASIGFGTEEYVRGQLSWTHRNVFGRGHKLTVSGRSSFIEQLVSVDYLIPYVYNPKSSIVISPFGQHLLEKSFELYRAGIINSFIYQYRKNATGSASYEFTKNLESTVQSLSSLPDSTLSYDLSSLQLSGYYSQELSREPRGWLIQPYVELSGLLGLATFHFQKFSLDVRRYTPVTETTTLATRLQLGGVYDVDTDTLPGNIRLYLGGTNSVRGWYRQELGPKRVRLTESENIEYIPTGGRAMLGFNIEVRQNLPFLFEGFGIAAFLDGGQIWQRMGTIGNRPVQFGTGGGFRYQSPLGPIRIDVGYKLNPNPGDLGIRTFDEEYSIWRRIGIHFSIGQAF